MSLRKLFKTDATLEQEGVTIDYGPNEDLPPGPDGVRPSMRFKIGRAGGANKAHEKALSRLIKPHKRAAQIGTLSNEVAKNIDREAWLETCLLGWSGVALEEGVELPFSKENAVRLFAELPDLYTALREESNSMALFREDTLEADLGNSGRSLNTDSSKDQ